MSEGNNRLEDFKHYIDDRLEQFKHLCDLKHENVNLELSHSNDIIEFVKEGTEKLEKKIQDIATRQYQTAIGVLLQLIAFIGAILVLVVQK